MKGTGNSVFDKIETNNLRQLSGGVKVKECNDFYFMLLFWFIH